MLPITFPDTFPKDLVQWRKKVGFTQQSLAAYLTKITGERVSRSMVDSYEVGVAKPKSPILKEKLYTLVYVEQSGEQKSIAPYEVKAKAMELAVMLAVGNKDDLKSMLASYESILNILT